MEIEWLGHSCFKITKSTGTVIITDPYKSYVGFGMPKISGDIVTVSHGHDDHNNIEGVGGDFLLIDKPDVVTCKGVTIMGFKSFHDSVEGKLRGENIVFKYSVDGMDICHLGDIGENCSVDLINDIMPIDVLLIPVGGKYTIDAERAKAYVDALMPSIVIPMHYRTKNCAFDIDKLDNFLKLFNEDDIIFIENNSISIDMDDVSADGNTRVVVFENKAL